MRMQPEARVYTKDAYYSDYEYQLHMDVTKRIHFTEILCDYYHSK